MTTTIEEHLEPDTPTGIDAVPERLWTTELGAFVDEHYSRLIRLATLVCHRVDEAEDIVQSALERAVRSRDGLRDAERLRPWLDRIVVREASRTARSRRPVVAIDLATAGSSPAPSDEWASMRAAFARLTVEQRSVIALHLYRGYSVAETADLLGVPVETVRSRLRVARDQLRHFLGPRGS